MFRTAVATGTLCLPISVAAQTVGSNPPPGSTADAEALEKISLAYFSATPSATQPFDPSPANVRWRVALPSEASVARLAINGSPVPSQGELHVRPERDTTYSLVAALGQARRLLGVVTVALDSSRCSRVAYYQEALQAILDTQLATRIPPQYQNRIYDARSSVFIDPAGVHMHISAKLAVDLEAGGITISEWPDPDLIIDILCVLRAERGRLDVQFPRFDVNIDSDVLADAAVFFASPSSKRDIEGQIYEVLSRALSDQIVALVQSHVPAGFRLWEISTASAAGNLRGVDQTSCLYPRPWDISVTFATMQLSDPVDVARRARVVLDLNFGNTQLARVGPLNFAVGADGNAPSLTLPRGTSFTVKAGVLDTLWFTVVAHDADKMLEPVCTRGQRPPCVTTSPPEVDRMADWRTNFAEGNHIDRSSMADGEWFDLGYSVSVRFDCPVCISSSSPD